MPAVMILNYGSLNVDVVFEVPHFVRPGETLAPTRVQIHAGGKGANQSVALARAGAEVAHAGKVGKDGLWMKDLLAREGVDVSRVVVDADALSGQAIIQVVPSGENGILLSPGTNAMIRQDEVDRALDGRGRGDVLLLQNEVNDVALLVERGRSRDMMIVFNAAPCGPEVRNLPLDRVDLLVVNETEGAELTGRTLPAEILLVASEKWPDTAVLLTLGGEGAWFSHRRTRIHQAVFPTRVVDTTAAGDTFLGFFLAAWSKGTTPAESLRLASIASALAVSRAGAAESIPTLREVQEKARELA